MRPTHWAGAIGAGMLVLSVAGSASLRAGDAAQAGLGQAADLSQGFKSVVRKVGPSVVHITSIAKSQAEPASAPDADMLRRFFGDRRPPGLEAPHAIPGSPERRGTGSGVVADERGYILTNNHVVAGSDQLLVKFDDGREYEATIVGADPETDLAVIKVDAGGGLTAAVIGDSEQLEPGDWVVAIGNPFGLDHTVTAGIVSATGRQGMGLATFENFIQTDAAINPGNSGGPLVNLRGEVVGINTAITSRTGGNLGVGFAVPSSIFKGVLADLLDDGRMNRGWLGVSIQELTPELAQSFGAESTQGALVAGVVSGSPAERAGLEPGDIIRSVGGRAVASPQTLMNTIAAEAPGATVELALERDGAHRNVEVVLEQRPGAPGPSSDGGAAPPEATSSLGMRLEPLTPDLARQLGTKAAAGMVVVEVTPGGNAAEAGLEQGDVILEVSGKAAATPAEFEAAVRAAHAGGPGKPIRLHVQRGDALRFMVLKPTAGGGGVPGGR